MTHAGAMQSVGAIDGEVVALGAGVDVLGAGLEPAQARSETETRRESRTRMRIERANASRSYRHKVSVARSVVVIVRHDVPFGHARPPHHAVQRAFIGSPMARQSNPSPHVTLSRPSSVASQRAPSAPGPDAMHEKLVPFVDQHVWPVAQS